MVIICDPIGGLGNQLFQIANTISLAIDNNADWAIHKRKIGTMYAFGHRNVYWDNLFKNISAINIDLKKGNKYKEPKFGYEKIIPDLKIPRTVLCGYFQSYKYFHHNIDSILKILINDKILDDSKKIMKNIKEQYEKKNLSNYECVSLHVRRGDYLNHPSVHKILPLEYYIQIISNFNNINTLFLIFSDDIEWCKENIIKYCANNILIKNTDYIDLILMSLCDHNIIANSSFSWWGAYLNSNSNKKIYYPSQWFNEDGPQDTQDLCPDNWICIDVL